MGSEPDLSHQSHKTSSRDGSLLSLNSTSTYYTAKEGDNTSTSTSLYFTPGGSIGSNASRREGESGDEQILSPEEEDSGTLEEAESITSTMGSRRSSSPSSENMIEVREDISQLCNTIAESEGFDGVKKSRIEIAIRTENLGELGQLAMSDGGLLSNALRTKAWPLLLKVPPYDINRCECKKVPTYYPDVPEKISNLVHLDVARVLKRFPPGLTDPQQDHLQMYLNNLICSVLQENRKAYYYQGFHDISLTFLLVSVSQRAPYLAYLCLNKMIETNLVPYMEKTMDRTHDVIHTLFALLEAEDPILFKKIAITAKCPVAFCLPWVLTWYAHTLPSDTDVFRLYDFILGAQERLKYPYLIPIFVSSTLLLRRAQSIKNDDSLSDIASMHHRLAKLPSELESLEPWLADSIQLMKKYQGKEDFLVQRGIAIKTMQHRLWNEDNNNQLRPRRNVGVVNSVGRFFFVRHRWATVSIVILGAAVLLQSRYGRSLYKLAALRALVESYAPPRFQSVLNYWLVDESLDD